MALEDTQRLVIELAALTRLLEQRSRSAVHQVEQAARAMDEGTRQLVAQTGGLTREMAQALQRQAGDMFGQGLGSSVEQLRQQLGSAANAATSAASTLEGERKALQHERRTWLWLGCGALLIGTALAVLGSGYAVMQSRKEVQQNRVEAELLRAYNRADVTLCGERLCANVDDKATRVGERRQYRVVKNR